MKQMTPEQKTAAIQGQRLSAVTPDNRYAELLAKFGGQGK